MSNKLQVTLDLRDGYAHEQLVPVATTTGAVTSLVIEPSDNKLSLVVIGGVPELLTLTRILIESLGDVLRHEGVIS